MAPPRKPLTPDDTRHGTPAGYRAGCRQACCRTAWAAYQTRSNLARQQLLAEGAEIEHGTKASYDNWRCRCGPCVDAMRAWGRDYRAWRRTQAVIT